MTFKVGDRIRRVGDNFAGVMRGDVVTVAKVTSDGEWVYLDGRGDVRFDVDEFDSVKTPHKHAALIKAWADGAAIQIKDEAGDGWADIERPAWRTTSDYRIKPEPKPDVVQFGYTSIGALYMADDNHPNANLKCTFDGETGKLKQVELLA